MLTLMLKSFSGHRKEEKQVQPYKYIIISKPSFLYAYIISYIQKKMFFSLHRYVNIWE